MVFLRRNESEMYICYNDNIIQYNNSSSEEVQFKIPKPSIPKDLKDDQIKVVDKDIRNIVSVEFSPSDEYILVSTENKQIVVYDNNLKVVKNFIVTRAPSKACFTLSNDILVADKTGDVYLYKLQDEQNKPVLLFGHLSVILDMIISHCGKYIITCDRDEKIRVSHFPNCYNIASYCLGHSEFVTKIKTVKDVLISASGDGTIRFWNFISGTQLSLVDTNFYIADDNILQSFCLEMIKEKVEITALPITDMQMHFNQKLYMAVSIYKYDHIQLYCVDMSNFDVRFITKLKVGPVFTFCLYNELYVFNNRLSQFKLIDNNFIESTESWLDKLNNKYKDVLNFADSYAITVLYKRKYDNVQDYFERKKQRL